MYTIDTKTYNKTRHAVGYGYDNRPNGRAPTSIVIHSTNGNTGSTFAGEGAFLRDSKDVSAHYLVGKQGQIAEFLAPSFRAWHSGNTREGFFNSDSIGIETHISPGVKWTTEGTRALEWLVKHLVATYGIGRNRIDTHRAVALPSGRKSDPSQFSDKTFYTWREGLFTMPELSNPAVIGVGPSCTNLQWTRSLVRNTAPFSSTEIERGYTWCLWNDIDPAFAIGLMKHEGNFGKSPLQQITKNPFNIKAESGDDRLTYTDANNRTWLTFESYWQGFTYGIVHLKWIYGSAGYHNVKEIIERFAPALDENVPAKYHEAIMTDMEYVRNN